jgi:F420-dependent oxidoreductase-like protein
VKIGAMVRGMTVEQMSDVVSRQRDDGYSSTWLTDGYGMEPLTVLATVGRVVPDIELGTAVVRTLPRHPMVLAQQAMTVNAIIEGRLALGIGPSHKPGVESGWGLEFDPPIARMSDYLSIMLPLLTGGTVNHDGRTASAHGRLFIENYQPCQVLVGALGPQMLKLAGRAAHGTITFMTGPKTLLEFTCPTILDAAERAGRPRPRIVSLIGLCVTSDVSAARERAIHVAGRMAELPSYAAMIQREGGPALICGTEVAVFEKLQSLAKAGVSDFVPISVARRDSPESQRTDRFVQQLLVERALER